MPSRRGDGGSKHIRSTDHDPGVHGLPRGDIREQRQSPRGVGVGLVEGFPAEQRLGESVEPFAIRAQGVQRLRVAFVHDAACLDVDEFPRGRCDGVSERRFLARGWQDAHRSDPGGHAPPANHLPGDLPALLEVALRAGGDVPVEEFLGRPAPPRSARGETSPSSRSGRSAGSGTSRRGPARAG
jgi:hypothetical protein